jgi:hypothetical protein
MFQLFQTYVASVLFGWCICCTSYTRMLQAYVSNVSAISNICFIGMLHMLHMLYKYVESVCFNCFNYVAIVLSGCCICCRAHTHMLQTYVVNVSPVSDVCCSKCFKLQVFHEQAWQGGTGEGGPLGRSGPRMRTGSEASAVRGAEHEAICMGVAVGTEHETASIGEEPVQSTR